MRRRKLPLPIALAYLLLVLFVGAACIYNSVTTSDGAALFPFALLMVVYALTIATLLVLRRRLPHGIPAPRTAAAPDGEQSLMVPRWPAPWFGTASLTAALVFMFGFWAVEAALQPRPVWVLVVVLALVGLWLGCLVGFVLSGRMRAGGLYLTEHQLIHRLGSAVSSVRWEDISEVAATTTDGRPPNVFGHNVIHRYTTPFFRIPKMPKLDHVDEASGLNMVNRMFLRFDDLELTPDQCAELISYYQRTPAARAELGQPESVTRARSMTGRDDGVVHVAR